ncbi:MAG: HD domain-containing protein [Ferruginibacter sp.]
MHTQSLYQKAIKFATLKHLEKKQLVPGTNMPYVVHLSNVAMEIFMASQHSENFNLDLAIQAGLLHDTLEDTATTVEELTFEFGDEVSEAVLALTKNDTLPKAEKMQDSLQRIKKLSKAVWAVKLADRITNLQPPPAHWDNEKKKTYRQEAITIAEELKGGNSYLETRLQEKIAAYANYFD